MIWLTILCGIMVVAIVASFLKNHRACRPD